MTDFAKPEYLGDGVYAEYGGYYIRIFTSDGYAPQNEIYLEPAVIQSLLQYIEKLKGEA